MQTKTFLRAQAQSRVRQAILAAARAVISTEGYAGLSMRRLAHDVGYTPKTLYRYFTDRSYWIPGSYAPALYENRNSFLRLLKNKGFKEERMTKVGLYALGSSTTLESNKSPAVNVHPCCSPPGYDPRRQSTRGRNDHRRDRD